MLHSIVASVINDFFFKTQFTSTWRWFEVKCYTWISEHLYLEASVYAWDLPPFSWWFSVKWSCKDFGDLTCHQDLTYTSVHVIWENVSYSDDSLIFGTQSEDIHFLLLCWGLLTVHTLFSGFAGLPPFWTQPVPRSWETFFFVWTNLNSAHWSFPLPYHQRQWLCTRSFSQVWIRRQSSVTLSAKDTRHTSKKSLWSPSG